MKSLRLPIYEQAVTGTNKADSINYAAVRAVIEENFGSIEEFLVESEIESFLVNMYNAGGNYTASKAGVTISFDLKDPVLMQNLKDQSKYLIKSVDQTTKDQLAKLISGGMDEGLNWKQIAGNIQTSFPDIATYRSELIARTETANAAGLSSLDFYQKNGFTEKIWVLGGNNICPICQANADQGPIPVNSAFQSGDDSFPAHPNCMCSLDSVLPDDFDPARAWVGNTSEGLLDVRVIE